MAIHGTVIRVSNVKPLVKKMAFSCNLCSETQVSINGVFACCWPVFLLSTPLLSSSSFCFTLYLSLSNSAFSPFLIPLFTPSSYLLRLNPLPASLPPSLPLSLPASYFPPSLPPSLPSYPTSFPGLSSYCPLGQAWDIKIRPCE